MIIESRANEKIKQAAALADSAKARRETGMFFLEGLRLCCDAALTGIEIRRLFYTAEAASDSRFKSVLSAAREQYEISDGVAQRLSKTQSAQGIFCVCAMPGSTLSEAEIKPGGRFVALENIQDPANLGAVCRTAEALGISGAALSNCCDPYNPKAQRASMGSLLRLPMLVTDDLPSLLERIRLTGLTVYAAVPDRDARDIRTADFSNGAVAVIGNEANGISVQSLAQCEAVTVPMGGRAESLNASAAAAIVMWEMMRGAR